MCQVDCWALGCLAYELLAGWSPFMAEDPWDTRHNIIAGAAHVSLGAMRASAAARAFVQARSLRQRRPRTPCR